MLSRLPPDLHEVLLVDGRSTDQTVPIAKAIRHDVRAIQRNVISNEQLLNAERRARHKLGIARRQQAVVVRMKAVDIFGGIDG